MITQGEWLMANVYAASLIDTRISKLRCLTDGIVKKSEKIQRPAPIKLEDFEEKKRGKDKGEQRE